MEAELLEGSLSGNLGLLKKALAMPGTQINTADNVSSKHMHPPFTYALTLTFLHLHINTMPSQEGRMALFIAAREGKEEAVGILLAAGADVGAAAARDGDSALIIAAAEGHVRVVGLLLAAGAVAQQTNGKGWSPCMYAAYYGHLDVVQLLLDWDANAGWIDSR
jgi:ankyrin repeat protein